MRGHSISLLVLPWVAAQSCRIPPESGHAPLGGAGWGLPWFSYEYLVGGVNALKNISQLGWLFQIYGKIKNVPNHNPDKDGETGKTSTKLPTSLGVHEIS